MNESTQISDDILVGAGEISEFLFGNEKKRRRVYNLADSTQGSDKIPCFRMGALLCARKSTLRQWILDRESAA